MNSEVDYPAAHSMDTEWFAIDADGNVGVFDSGEPGAVPSDAIQDDAYRLLELPVTGEPVFDRAGHVPLLTSPQRQMYHDTAGQQFSGRLLFLASEAEIPAELRALPGVVTPAAPDGWAVNVCVDHDLDDGPETDPVAAFVLTNRELWTRFVQRVHAEGWCLGCHYVYESEIQFVQRGAFHYSAQEILYIAEPYGRIMQPSRPLHVSELPADLRTIAEQRQLPHRFADTVFIQPAEHMHCQIWGSEIYLSEDGSTIRGEARVLEEIREMAAEFGVRTEESA
jgi:hypothetical protein